jgi:hypothetical protein
MITTIYRVTLNGSPVPNTPHNGLLASAWVAACMQSAVRNGTRGDTPVMDFDVEACDVRPLTDAESKTEVIAIGLAEIASGRISTMVSDIMERHELDAARIAAGADAIERVEIIYC